MSEVVYLPTNRTSTTRSTMETRGTFGPRVYVREAQAGLWIVHDETDKKGGCFCDHATAYRFATDEFGADAEIVVQPQFPATSKTVSHFKQTVSVAHKAVAAR